MRFSRFFIVAIFLLSACENIPDFPDFVQDFRTITQDDNEKHNDIFDGSPEDFDNAVVEIVASEDLLGADGNWNVVEQGRSLDPAKAHLAARNRVNTKRRKRMEDLTAHFEPDAKSGQDGTLRIIKIEATEEIPEFEVASNTSPEPENIEESYEDFNRGQSSFLGLRSLFKRVNEIPTPDKKPLKNNSEPELALLSLRQKTEGVITPPQLPQFRKPPKALSQKASVVIPGRKPDLRKSAEVLKSQKVTKVHVSKKQAQLNKSKTSKAIKIRSGRHPGRTRLVLEVTKLTKYKVAIDSIRNVLRIKMDRTDWDMKPQSVLKGSRLFGTYIARDLKDGSVLFEVRLSKKTKILDTLILPPNKDAKHRIVIDLND